MPNAMCVQSSSTALSRSSSSPRAERGAIKPSLRDHKASCGTGGLPVTRGNGGSSTLWRAIASYRRQTLFCFASPEKGEPSVTTARTRSGNARATSRANSPPRLQPTSSTFSFLEIWSSRCLSRATVSARAPQLTPISQPCTRQPSAASARRSARVARSCATKPGITSAGGPSTGPMGFVEPNRRHIRGRIHAASPRRKRSGGGRSSPCQSALEIFAPHQLLQRPRQLHPSVLGLMVLDQRDEDPRRGERGVVERVREPHLSVASPVADVGPSRLPVVQRRAAVGLAILGQARNPALEVVHAIFAEAHVAGRRLDHLIGDFQFAKQHLRQLEQPCVPVRRLRVVGLANHILLDLHELVDPQQPPHVLAGASRLAAETWGIAGVEDRQFLRLDDLARVKRGQHNFGGSPTMRMTWLKLSSGPTGAAS